MYITHNWQQKIYIKRIMHNFDTQKKIKAY